MTQYNLYEEQIKILMKDAFIQGIKVALENQEEDDKTDNFFENWYKNYVYNRKELDK